LHNPCHLFGLCNDNDIIMTSQLRLSFLLRLPVYSFHVFIPVPSSVPTRVFLFSSDILVHSRPSLFFVHLLPSLHHSGSFLRQNIIDRTLSKSLSFSAYCIVVHTRHYTLHSTFRFSTYSMVQSSTTPDNSVTHSDNIHSQ
jgi:hypothetical protein